MELIVQKIQQLIEQFVNSKDMSSFYDEAQFRTALSRYLSTHGVSNIEEADVEIGKDCKYRCDIMAHVGDEYIPIELKLNNASIDEYKEDEKKCEQYVDAFRAVNYAFCVFVSNIEHVGYYQEQWKICASSKGYKYLVLMF